MRRRKREVSSNLKVVEGEMADLNRDEEILKRMMMKMRMRMRIKARVEAK